MTIDTGRITHRDEMHRGHAWKRPCRVATTANIAIATALNAGDTIDGVVLEAGMRVLVKNQTAPEENGIYVSGTAPARAFDFDSADEIVGALVLVVGGTTNAGKLFLTTNAATPVLDTTSIGFVEFAPADANGVTVAHLLTGHAFVIGAHRGDIGNDGDDGDSYPENTLEAVRQAAIKGAQIIEFDLLRDSDGVFQVIHDTTVDRTTDGTGNVSGKTAVQMAALAVDGGFGYNATRHGMTLNVPTAQQVIDGLLPYDVVLGFDLKESSDAAHTALAELIVANDITERSIVRAVTVTGAAAVKAVDSRIQVGMFSETFGGTSNPQDEANVDSWWARNTEVDNLAETVSKAPDRIDAHFLLEDYYGTDIEDEIRAMFARGVRSVLTHELDSGLALRSELLQYRPPFGTGAGDMAAGNHTHASTTTYREVAMTGSGASLEPVTNTTEDDWLYGIYS